MPPARTPADVRQYLAVRHHRYLQRELPLLAALALRVREAHGAHDERLGEVVAVLARLRAELEAHVSMQERLLLGSAMPERELLERHARELEAEIAGLALLTGGFRADPALSDDHRVLVTRLSALAADTRHQLRTEREFLHPLRTALPAA